MGKDVIIRSSVEEFITFKVQEKDKGIQVRYENELDKNSVCSILEHTAEDGKKYQTDYYNLDAIISVGYRVKQDKLYKSDFDLLMEESETYNAENMVGSAD